MVRYYRDAPRNRPPIVGTAYREVTRCAIKGYRNGRRCRVRIRALRKRQRPATVDIVRMRHRRATTMRPNIVVQEINRRRVDCKRVTRLRSNRCLRMPTLMVATMRERSIRGKAFQFFFFLKTS